jgi:hypothetical protein
LAEVSSALPFIVDAGSFRDRDGRIYRQDQRIIRGVSEGALEAFRKLTTTSFYRKYLESGALVASEELAPDDVPLPENIRQQWAGFIEHQQIPVISYPYEWTFGMLRDAALLQLDLLEAAIGEGMTLKDATPYNIQFLDGQPVFIDIPSFETLPKGAAWAGYRQFCEMFLFPLMLQAYKGVHFQPLMRASIDGIDVQTATRLFGFRDRFRGGVFSHVWLQAKLDRRFGGTRKDVRSELKSAGFHKELILANVRKLKKLVTKLNWQGNGSEWGSYDTFHNYSESDHGLKETFISDCVSSSKADLVWDIGCNTGQFSKIAARHADIVLAMDLDHFAVERLYQELKSSGSTGILPLLQNIADPSPNWGWRNQERTDLASRARPDLLLCLALIHHVVISANIPLAEFINWLAGLTDKLVIEYVSRNDDKVQTLLRNKEDKYQDYSRESLEANLKRHFDIRRQQDVNNGDRTLYLCVKPRAAIT